ncbi:MoxR-like ATPase [Wenyingzhuangia heitensis]|uniref:MoxR-like ATPase n=1 Tax=Wenyingzhuangia heitensis TaxID=1487859 RepID=A0ABX0U609_9FLAO|nr:MoxR family ATPase [Wenyingzhuangia heitensis]NIJ44198.1 MoxR-like ATPase [Wenyingzhuangia heitensis]
MEELEFSNRIDLTELHQGITTIKQEISKVIVGQKDMVNLLLTALLCEGHVLIEGVPGVAKTITAKLLAKTLAIGYQRIQFTPDLMPSDVLGTSIFDLKKSEFEFKKGPIFSNLILIDEINRAPAKTQAALFEVMEEQQVTIDGIKYDLESPYFVVATQNPVDQEGTYRLPEAQLDRFLFKITVDYPNVTDEVEILNREHQATQPKLDAVTASISKEQIIAYQQLTKQVIVEPKLIQYIADIVVSTRSNSFLYLGASPRASIALLKASKAFAAINGRDFVTPEDIKQVAVPVLQHRVIVTPEREMEGITAAQIINDSIQSTEIPS